MTVIKEKMMEMIDLLKAKWRYVTFGLLLVMLAGNHVYAAEAERTFFWSDAVPIPDCYTSRDGEPKELGVEKDGKKVIVELPSCEEAKKTHVSVRVDGKYLHAYSLSGAEPYIENGRTMIPLRALADGFGFEVAWEPTEQKITLKKDTRSIMMYIGKSEMLVDGKEVKLEEAVPMIKNDLTFLPVRQLAEILGVQVDWDESTRTATFTQ
ncbi:stalk domain-containing protein [Paenibacillus puerhi]|uniref:stalk domain-containing protein n=1 Tax=Paenibacillus puerhi TaxID=2692622 RepID=UPI0013573392|nr:stalk domain-containing protein [Paenibacillus puerhi]